MADVARMPQCFMYVFEPKLGLDGTIGDLLRWAHQYTEDYSDDALMRIAELARNYGIPADECRIPVLELRDRRRAAKNDGTLPYERAVIDLLLDGRTYLSEAREYGQVSLSVEGDRILVVIDGEDSNGPFTAADTCSRDEFLSGDDSFLERLVGQALYYGKSYVEGA